MNYKTTTCLHCGKERDLYIGEYNRKIKKGTPFFCSQVCSSKHSTPQFLAATEAHRHSLKNKQRLEDFNRIKTEKTEPFKYFLRNCKKRHKDFDLDVDYLKDVWASQKGLCALTNVPMELPLGTKGFSTIKPFNGASLDRIDSSIGYIKGNVQLVCMGINLMKSDWEQEYLIKHLITFSKSVLDKYKDMI